MCTLASDDGMSDDTLDCVNLRSRFELPRFHRVVLGRGLATLHPDIRFWILVTDWHSSTIAVAHSCYLLLE